MTDTKSNPPTAESTEGISPEATNYQPLTKYYVFNETGNILLCTTGNSPQDVSDDFKAICAEVSVFFAAMTKAISSVENPFTKKPYSIYNYKALKQVMDNSGVFIGVNQTRSVVSSDQIGDVFSRELLQSLLGCDFGQTKMGFAKSVFESIGKESEHLVEAVKTFFDSKDEKDKEQHLTSEIQSAGNLFFVCESLLGMPLITAVLVHIKPEDADKPLHWITSLTTLRPKKHRIFRSYSFSKDTYLFVAPQFFKKHINDLNLANSPEYQSFVNRLAGSLEELGIASQHTY